MFITFYQRVVQLFCLPLILNSFFSSHTGKVYRVGFIAKCLLLWKFIRNTKKIPTASSWYEHLFIAQAILSLPRTSSGVVVECGAYKGGSTANLSLVCKLVGRKLLVFDSFAGLPQPQSSDSRHHCPAIGEIHTYSRGAFKGRLADVKSNIRRYGNLETCEFIPGYFSSTLPIFTKRSRSIACVFTDVDLVQSLKTCLKYLWPKLIKNGFWFTHEAQHQEIAQVFFDTSWWRHHLHQKPSGLIGASIGLKFGLQATALGYIIKSSTYSIKPQQSH